MLRLLVINLLISLLWPTLNGNFNLVSLFTGFAIGFILLSLIEPRYGRISLALAGLVVYVLYQILESNVRLAWQVLRALPDPEAPIHPGIVAVPLTITHDLDKTVLASIITLTPGTLSVDLGHNAAGQEVLYVHTIEVRDPEAFRQAIKEKFERRLLQIRRGFEEDV